MNGNMNGKIFSSYCYMYPINQNGEYTFTFIGNDGKYGEVTVEINDENPQIVSTEYLDSPCMMLMLGLDNFVDMEEVELEIISRENKINFTTQKEVINLIPYVSTSIYGFPNNVKGIDLAYVPTLNNHNILEFEGKIICKYKDKEINRMISLSINYNV